MNKDIGRKAEDTKRENTKITQIQKQIIMNVKNTENKRKVHVGYRKKIDSCLC